jgi:hypothetical protein
MRQTGRVEHEHERVIVTRFTCSSLTDTDPT